MKKKRFVTFLMLLFFLFIISLLSTTQHYMKSLLRGNKEVFFNELIYNFISWLPWILFVPVIFYLAGRFQIKQNKIYVTVPVHITAAICMTVIHAVCHAYINTFFNNFNHELNINTFFYVSVYLFNINFLVYFIILGSHFLFDIYQKYREREMNSLRLQNQLTAARLEVLKIQLHPHFLFNTLHTVSALIPRDPDAADRMIGLLSDLLRMTLESSQKQEIPLKEELEFLKIYLEIEKSRYQERLNVKFDVYPEILDVLVPNLLLQPLIENSVRHGISPRAEGGNVIITIKKVNGNLFIEIGDNGVGLKKSDSTKIIEGFGLKNTRERLRQLYGNEFYFEIKNAENGGCIVNIEIPYRISEEKIREKGDSV